LSRTPEFGDLNARFARDYTDARAKFLSALRLLGGRHRAYANPNRAPGGEELTTDTAWLGPEQAEKVLVLVSATHGVEGFCGSGAQLDWLLGPGLSEFGRDTALLVVHAINPHGFAWLRRVTEEGCDLNRNFVDFAKPLPANAGYDELAADWLPPQLQGPQYEEAESKIRNYRSKHGEKAYMEARSGGQWKHPHGFFYGGAAPTWSRRTLEAIIADEKLAGRRCVAVIDYHTGLGPHGYGEPICGHEPGTRNLEVARRWYGDSLTVPSAGTSSSVVKQGLAEHGWRRLLGDRFVYVALEYGTYPPETVRRVMQEDHWHHRRGAVDWGSAEVQRAKQALKRHYYPGTRDWQEMVLFRSRQIIRQALAGLTGEG
jgi:Protein of unknown function (DUF2817)